MKRFLLAALFAALSAPVTFAATAEKPALKINTLDGKTFDLAAEKGKWVIVNFWATWCSPCIKEMPDISAFVAAHKDVAAIGLALEDTEKAEVEAFAKAHPTSYPLAQVDLDHPPADFDTPRGLPMTVLVGPDGKVVKTITGPVTAHDLETAIAAAGGPKAG